jgi:hypothetical protein
MFFSAPLSEIAPEYVRHSESRHRKQKTNWSEKKACGNQSEEDDERA